MAIEDLANLGEILGSQCPCCLEHRVWGPVEWILSCREPKTPRMRRVLRVVLSPWRVVSPTAGNRRGAEGQVWWIAGGPEDPGGP